ncbi:MAG: hypothetical protein AB1551_06675 [Actinomycetota bacterium]
MDEEIWAGDSEDEGQRDPVEEEASEALERFFDSERETVFFSRQLEVMHEDRWFHWVTNRALRGLVASGAIKSEARALESGGSIHLMWHRAHRYYRRDAARVVKVVEAYADPNIGAALGLHGELMVLEGFARHEFVMRGRNTRSFGGRTWVRTRHDLDFIFEKGGKAYGVEVKNTLGYMEHEELDIKIRLSLDLGLKPVFAARMLPKSWVYEVVRAGGFALILKYQLYPWAHRDLARRVRGPRITC